VLGAIRDAEVYFGFGIPRELFVEAKKLRWVHSAAAGVGTALHEEMKASDVILTNSAGVHAHPNQTETFRILDGSVGFRLGRGRLAATSGETVVVKAGTAHTFWNAGEDRARFLCEIRPALGFERLLETMFALARDGKTNGRGLPHPLRLAAIADHHRDDLQLPILPLSVQRLAAKVGATAAWALTEFGPTYDGTRPDSPALRTIHPQRTAS
jgi:mannose-6-phosphate isomerase-like protein (cupin superfamily)